MNPESKEKKITPLVSNIILAFIIIVSLARATWIFANERTSWHSDELWSYGLSNSYYEPQIFANDDETQPRHIDEWVDGETFKDYITVKEDERFSYGSVIYNLKHDMHPPLYFMVLHTICSFFPGQFSLWYGYAINIVTYIFLMIAFRALARRLLKSEAAALFVTFFYAFNNGTLNTMLFVRQYAPLTLFTVLFAIVHLKMIEENDDAIDGEYKKITGKQLVTLGVLTFLGTMTHYYFGLFAFVFAFFYCFYYFYRKQYNNLLSYAGAMLAGIVAILPFTGLLSSFTRYTSEKGVFGTLNMSAGGSVAGLFKALVGAIDTILNIPYDPLFDPGANVVLDSFSYDFFGVHLPFSIPFWFMNTIMLAAVFAGVWIVLSLFLCRIEGHDNDLLFKAVRKTAVCVRRISRHGYFILTYIVTAAFFIYVVIGISLPTAMKDFVDRYFFLLYPFTVLVLFLAVKKISVGIVRIVKIEKLPLTKAIIVFFMVFFLSVDIVCGGSIYNMSRGDEKVKIEKLCEDKECVLVLSENWVLAAVPSLFMNSERVFVTNTEDLEKYIGQIAEIRGDEFYICIFPQNYIEMVYQVSPPGYEIELEDVEFFYMDLFKETWPDAEIECLYNDYIYTRDMLVYRVTG